MKDLSFKLDRLSKQHKAKTWLYLRWMVRSYPDLALFKYDPRDLMVPLTTPKLRVLVALELVQRDGLAFLLNSKNRPKNWWRNTAEFDQDAETLTDLAHMLFPEDPAVVDFPFFLLGTWLEYADLTSTFLAKSLLFLNQKYRELHKPMTRYLAAVAHYNRIGELVQPGAFTGLESDVYDFLKKKQVIYSYEFIEFRLSKTDPATKVSLTYKPDFLLPQYTDQGRKVILEPHGVRSNLKAEISKLAAFRRDYGDFFCLILVVPDDFVGDIQVLDPQSDSYDLLWKTSDYKIQFEKFRKS